MHKCISKEGRINTAIISKQIHKWHLMHDKFCLILPGRWIRKHIVRYSAVSLQCASAWLMKVTAAGRGTAGQRRHQIMRGHSNNLPDKVRDGEPWWAELSYGEQGDKGDFTHQPAVSTVAVPLQLCGHTAITTILWTICKMMFHLQWLIFISVNMNSKSTSFQNRNQRN